MRRLILLVSLTSTILMSGCINRIENVTGTLDRPNSITELPILSPAPPVSTDSTNTPSIPTLVPTQVDTNPLSIDDSLLLSSGFFPGTLFNASIYLLDLNCLSSSDGCAARIKPLVEDEETNLSATWSFDGELIAFLSDRDSNAGNLNLYLLDPETLEITRLTSGEGYREQHAWSPAELRIAYVLRPNNDWRSLIGVIDLEVGTGWQIPSPNTYFQPSWSPDGIMLAFLGSDDEGIDLFVSNINGEEIKRLTYGEKIYENKTPSWSIDGKTIAYSSQKDGVYSIFTIDVDTLKQSQLSSSESQSTSPSWSPDGNRLVYTCSINGNIDICVIAKNGSEGIRLTTDPSVDYGAQWSPDGNYIAFLSLRDGENNPQLYLTSPTGEWVVRIETSFPVASFSLKEADE